MKDEKRLAEEYRLALDIALMYDDLDPYGTFDAKEMNETCEEFCERIARETAGDWDALGDAIKGLDEMTEADDAEVREKVDALRVRLETLKAC